MLVSREGAKARRLEGVELPGHEGRGSGSNFRLAFLCGSSPRRETQSLLGFTASRENRQRGFTLVEVLVAIAIFILLAGGIFSAVSVTTTASAEVSTSQLETARMDAFQTFLRTLFLNLPAESVMEVRIRQEAGRGDVVELLMWPAPEIADFGSGERPSDGLAVAAQPDGNGNFTISLTNFDASEEPARRDAELIDSNWLPILPDIRTLRWRFGQQNGTPLVEEWGEPNGRPAMVDLELTRLDGSVMPLAFWLPPTEEADERGGGDAPNAGDGGGDDNDEGDER